MIRAFKAQGCAECNVRYPEADWTELHIAHLDKRDRTALRWKLERCTTAEIITELLKCRCLCHRCHVAEHAGPSTVVDGQISLFAGSGTWHYNGNGNSP